MAIVLDLVTASLKELGVLAATETPSAQDAQDALDTLNRMLDGMETVRSQIYTVLRTTWTISPGVATYAVGTGVTINRARPVFVNDVHFVDLSVNPNLELKLSNLTDDAYAGLAQKTLQAPYPSDWYYNPTYPTGLVTFYPVPSRDFLQGVMYAPLAVAQFTAVSDTVLVPPGYYRMLVKNLAVELAPMWEREVHPMLMKQSVDSMRDVKRANHRQMDLSVEPAALVQGTHGGGYNVYTDR